MNLRFIIFGMVWVLWAACTDIYEPDIESPDSYLVVEGLVTDQPGTHLVKLTRSSTFGEPMPRIMVAGAVVSISGVSGDHVVLTEERAGHYYTPDDYAAIEGEAYTLHIETADGQTYRSKEQRLMPPVRVDELTAEPGARVFLLSSSVTRTITPYHIEGARVYMTIEGQNNPRFRFTSHLLIDYFIVYPGIISTTDYCWLKRSVSDYLDTDVGQGIGSGITGRHQLGFIPALAQQLPYMGFPDYVTGDENTFYGSTRIIISKLYALNDDAYEFHQMRNKQLSDEGRFFDPIAAQLPGNISNIHDNRDPVLGLFEVSSVTGASVLVRVSPFEVTASMLNLVDTIPNNGCQYEQVPGFLRDIYYGKASRKALLLSQDND